jgi:hypothetical protein
MKGQFMHKVLKILGLLKFQFVLINKQFLKIVCFYEWRLDSNKFPFRHSDTKLIGKLTLMFSIKSINDINEAVDVELYFILAPPIQGKVFNSDISFTI